MDYLFIIIGLSIGIFLTWLFLVFKRKQVIHNDAQIVMSALKKVNKLITVEGEFSEIYKHEENKPLLFNLFQTEKKAIIIVKAKVLMGYDLSKLKYEINEKSRTLRILEKPKPEILNIWTDAEYYDVKNHLFSRFSKDQLKQLKEDANDFLLDKINTSDLPKMAQEQSEIGFSLLKDTTKSLGWNIENPL